MSIQLLDKTRKINKLLHNNASSVFVFSDVCKVLSEVLCSNVLVISKTGKILGISNSKNIPMINGFLKNSIGEYIEKDLNDRLLSILSTNENVNLVNLGFDRIEVKSYSAIITPIDIAGERLGTLFVYRQNEIYEIEDIILTEYGNTVVGLEMIRSVSDEKDAESRDKNTLESAINSLSDSEKRAIGILFKEFTEDEGMIVTSRLAQNANITRSVIVNAIRKLEGAGIIETRSYGMKGTYIKIVNSYARMELLQFCEKFK